MGSETLPSTCYIDSASDPDQEYICLLHGVGKASFCVLHI